MSMLHRILLARGLSRGPIVEVRSRSFRVSIRTEVEFSSRWPMVALVKRVSYKAEAAMKVSSGMYFLLYWSAFYSPISLRKAIS